MRVRLILRVRLMDETEEVVFEQAEPGIRRGGR